MPIPWSDDDCRLTIQVPLSGALVLGYFGAPNSACWCGGIRHCNQRHHGGDHPPTPSRAKLPANLRCRASGYDSITFEILAALRFQPHCRLSQP